MTSTKPCIIKLIQPSGRTVPVPIALLRGLRSIHIYGKHETEADDANAAEEGFRQLDNDIDVTDAQARTITALTTMNRGTRTNDYETLLEAGVAEAVLDVSGRTIIHDGKHIIVFTPKNGWRVKGSKSDYAPTLAHLLASIHGEIPPTFE
ncbi:hypothetical protein M2103_002673 [Ereboglobus sp. PH5-5]|nr:hypothetical protein [Ereboglobus sp. PH5-5]